MTGYVAELRKAIEKYTPLLEEMSDEATLRRPAPDKWCPREIIGHLIDSAANNHQRFVRAQFSNEMVFSGYEQEEWVRVQGYNQEPWQQLVQLWKHYNLHLVHLMSLVPEQARTKPRTTHNLDQIAWQTVAAKDSVTLEYFMRDYVAHLKNHLRQILRSD